MGAANFAEDSDVELVRPVTVTSTDEETQGNETTEVKEKEKEDSDEKVWEEL